MADMSPRHDRGVDVLPGGILVVEASHPSLDGELDRFFDTLHSDQPGGGTAPSPVVEALRCRDGVRLAAIECGRVIGVARVDRVGRVYVAVANDRRAIGVGPALARALIERTGRRSVPMAITRVA